MIRKFMFALSLMAVISTGAYAQICAGDSIYITPGSGTVPGFLPPDYRLPCINNGSYVSDTLYFTNYSTLHSAPLTYLTIDSISNLPGGLCWMPDTPGTTYGPGQNSAIYISGWCGTSPGQYKLKVFIDAGIADSSIQIFGQSAEAVFGLRYYLVVNCAGDSCPGIDTVNGKTIAFIADTVEQCLAAGIQEAGNSVSRLSVIPNPFGNAAVLSFTSNTAGAYTMKIADIQGAVVYTKKLQIMQGSNEIAIERDGLSPGMYILSLSGDMSLINRKIVIE